MVNYACAFSQLELGKYFERIIKNLMPFTLNAPLIFKYNPFME